MNTRGRDKRADTVTRDSNRSKTRLDVDECQVDFSGQFQPVRGKLADRNRVLVYHTYTLCASTCACWLRHTRRAKQMYGSVGEVEKMRRSGAKRVEEKRAAGRRPRQSFSRGNGRIRQEDGKQRMCTRTNGNRNTVGAFNKNAVKYLGEKLRGKPAAAPHPGRDVSLITFRFLFRRNAAIFCRHLMRPGVMKLRLLLDNFVRLSLAGVLFSRWPIACRTFAGFYSVTLPQRRNYRGTVERE